METVGGHWEFQKTDLIGHGAFAVVFKGRVIKTPEQAVAIKRITKKNLAKSQNLLSKEIKILEELSGLQHENVVRLIKCSHSQMYVYLVMEYCDGGDLADFLQAKGTLSEDTISSFLRQIAAAMKVMVERGIVHRDLKPQNLLLCNPPGHKQNPPPTEMILKIADFGFARFLNDGVMAATLCGSPMYMAPEVIMSWQYDARADLWSVGTIVYQCLTGKAPFQAQTPQQLKAFYEKNSNLAPNIPSGTSSELKDLLLGMLKRNAKDRIKFDLFFTHKFLRPKASPVPVPRSRSRSTGSESPASVKTVSASPLSTNIATSPPNPVLRRVRGHDYGGGGAGAAGPSHGAAEPMDQGHSPQDAAGFLKVASDGSIGGRCSSPMTTDEHDYVMVPENLPSDHSACSMGSQRPSSVDLTAIFSDNSPDSPRHGPRRPGSGRSTPRRSQSDLQQHVQSPSRPSTLPVHRSPSDMSQPIPVPTQVKAYEQIQRSSLSPSHSPVPPPGSCGSCAAGSRSPARGGRDTPPRRKSSVGSAPNVGSMSPPNVQFHIGTPPNTWRKNSLGGAAPPAAPGSTMRNTPPTSTSPLRRSGTSPGRLVCTPPFTGPSSLPTIVGSPTKLPSGFHFPTTAADVTDLPRGGGPAPGSSAPGGVSAGGGGGGSGTPSPSGSASGPINTPFGHNRNRTYPDNVAAVGYTVDGRSVVPLHPSHTEPQHLYHRADGNSTLSDQLFKAAFTQTNNMGFAVGSSPSRGIIVPYSSNTSLNRDDNNPGGTPGGPSGFRRHSTTLPYDMSPTGGVPLSCQSPHNMEGPISFVAPELAEETLMDKEHNETVAKLTFVLTIVECIVELAQSRSSPITESIDQKHGNAFKLENVGFVSESQRQFEQLVLHVRSLQLLNSAIQLAKEEIRCNRLQPSNSVKQVLKEMNSHYHQCLALCKHLHERGVKLYPEVSPSNAAITADRLIYMHAVELCQSAALDELFGNPHECFRRYRAAQILFHSLAQQAHNTSDKRMLSKYKESVEQRLYNLSSATGLVHAYDR